MAVVDMHIGEKVRIFCGSKYGYSKARRPPNVPEDVPLIFEVELRRFEQVSLLLHCSGRIP